MKKQPPRLFFLQTERKMQTQEKSDLANWFRSKLAEAGIVNTTAYVLDEGVTVSEVCQTPTGPGAAQIDLDRLAGMIAKRVLRRLRVTQDERS